MPTTMNTEPINFEGVIVVPNKNGIYKCPFKCGSVDYAQPTWKTEKGFRNHMAVCMSKPSAIEAAERRLEEGRINYEIKYKTALDSSPFKVGDKIVWIRKVIIKNTTEMRNGRAVRVRYVPIVRHLAQSVEIQSIDWNSSKGYILNHRDDYIVFDGSLDDALKEAEKLQASYEQMVREYDNS